MDQTPAQRAIYAKEGAVVIHNWRMDVAWTGTEEQTMIIVDNADYYLEIPVESVDSSTLEAQVSPKTSAIIRPKTPKGNIYCTWLKTTLGIDADSNTGNTPDILLQLANMSKPLLDRMTHQCPGVKDVMSERALGILSWDTPVKETHALSKAI